VKKIIITLMLVIAPIMLMADESEAGFGLGLHYLKTVEDMGETSGFDSSSLGYLGVYSFGPGMLNFELSAEYVPNYIMDEDLFQPAAYAFIGNRIYGGLGIGIGHFKGQWANDPFFDLRAGLKISVFDFFASYRIQKLDEVTELETDDFNSVTFGALFKF